MIIEHPIMFNQEMVRAYLESRKTMTRRVIKNQPDEDGLARLKDEWDWFDTSDRKYKCPYGKPGDLLTIKETWQYADWTESGHPIIRYRADRSEMLRNNITDEWGEKLADVWAKLSDPENYKIDGRAADRKWRSSMFMPSWAVRLKPKITNIRVERIQDISEEDAKAEGVNLDRLVGFGRIGEKSYREGFICLWDQINLKRGFDWTDNPHVWVVEFEKYHKKK